MIIDIHAHGCSAGGDPARNERLLLKAIEKYNIKKEYIFQI